MVFLYVSFQFPDALLWDLPEICPWTSLETSVPQIPFWSQLLNDKDANGHFQVYHCQPLVLYNISKETCGHCCSDRSDALYFSSKPTTLD